MKEIHKDKLGAIIDSINSLTHGLQLPIPAEMHIEQLAIILQEKVKELMELYIDVTGENPW